MRRPPRPWTHDDTRTLRRLARRGLSLREVAEQLDRDRSVVRERAKTLGIAVKRVCIKTPWTEDEDLLLDALYPFSTMERLRELLPGRTEPMIFNRANSRGLKKTAEFMREVHGARLQSHDSVKASRFQPGMTPWNKGTKGVMGQHPNSRRTQFRRGALPHTWRPIGSERVTPEGILEIKIRDTRVTRNDFVSVPRLVWERERGPIPDGHLVVFKRGMHTTNFRDITADRLECIDRVENMRRNSYHTRYPKEVARLVQLRGALTRKINSRSKALEHHE